MKENYIYQILKQFFLNSYPPEIESKVQKWIIKDIGDTYMLIEVADGVRIRVDKTSIFASAEDAQQQK